MSDHTGRECWQCFLGNHRKCEYINCKCCDSLNETEVNTYKLDVVAENGVPFRVVAVVNGKSENFQTASLGNRTLVEFYDRRYTKTPDGQFIGHCLYIDTALSGEYVMDFDIGMDSRTSRKVRSWLQDLVDSGSVRV